MIHAVMWKWLQHGYRSEYTAEHVNVLGAMLKRNMDGVPFRPLLITDDAANVDSSIDVHPLWDDFNDLPNASGSHLPSCYRRLRIFDPATQALLGIKPGDRIFSLDLDTVITGSLVPIVHRTDKFVGWQVRGTRHWRVYNGSMFLFDAGEFPELWTSFNPETSPQMVYRAGFFGSDQSWLSYNLVRRAEAVGLSYPLISSYPINISRNPTRLPRGCAIVNFHGRRKPWHEGVQRDAPWIKQHWRR